MKLILLFRSRKVERSCPCGVCKTVFKLSIMKRKAEDDYDYDSEERENHPVVRRDYRDYEVRELHKAYERCCIHELNDLFASGRSINETDIRLTSINCAAGIYLGFKSTDVLIGNEELENDPTVNLQRTPLVHAAYQGQAECVDYLLANGANIDAQDIFGCTALHYACFHECVREARYIDIVKSLLSYNADLSLRDSQGKTALMCTCLCEGSCDDLSPVSMQLLLDNGADIDAVDNDGWSALMHLCYGPRPRSLFKCVRILLAHNADVDMRDRDGDTLLISLICSRSGLGEEGDEDYDEEDSNDSSTSLVKLLIVEGGADVNIKNGRGESALFYSIISISHEYVFDVIVQVVVSFALDANLLKLLLEHGADVDEPLSDGKTALYWICEKERDEVAAGRGEVAYQSIELLLKHHASVHVIDSNGALLLDCPTLTERTRLLLVEAAVGFPLK